MSESLRNRISGLILLAVALVWIGLVYATIRAGQVGEVGPRAFPLFFGYVLALLSVIMVVQSFRPAAPDLDHDDATAAAIPREWVAVVATIVGIVIYGMLLEPFGFIPSTAAFVTVFLLLVVRVTSPVTVAGMAIGLSLGSYLVFGKLLGVYLPPGQIITIYF
jgi:putative tricarboxylic transport membrane protein